MNHFPQNLSILRRRAGYTQESLAEALGVSRQAVSKWEGGQGLPEAATLLTLAELLNCSLDALMREELQEEVPEGEPLEEMAEEDPYYIWEVYSQHMTRFALMMACGVATILAGVALTMVSALLFGDDNGLIAIPVLVAVAGAVFLFIYGGVGHDDFMKDFPVLPLCPYPEEREAFQRTLRLGLALSMGGILLGVALFVGVGSLFDFNDRISYLGGAAFLMVLALCVGAMVYLGIQSDKYDEEARDKALRDKNGPDVEGIIMLSAAAIFLYAGFVHNAWHPGWVVFPLGGILCAIVGEVRKGRNS